MSCFRFICLLLIFSSACATHKMDFISKKTKVVAHRGAWKKNGLPENSIASLRNAILSKYDASEFDVRMTADDSLIIYHDPDLNGLTIEKTNYSDLIAHRLANGEKLPTLKEYLKAGLKNNTSTSLFCEIKPSQISSERNQKITLKILNLVKELDANHRVVYISFNYEILKTIRKTDSKAVVYYLNGDKTPSQLADDAISGADYQTSIYKKHPDWIISAKNKNILLNAWTVNNAADMDWLLSNNFDYITTDEPELLSEMVIKHTSSNKYELVWSDEFNYAGRPNPKYWQYEYGFIRNVEKQYYTDNLKNARVENGVLILEARKENIKNDGFVKDNPRNWKEKDSTANYTSASINTKDLVMWKYGKIEVKAKLPKGVGLWPAIWMLGQNRLEVGWPKAGEIDIMEHVGFNKDSIFGTIPSQSYNHMKGTQKGKKIFIDNPYDAHHIYSIEWTPEKIDFLLDGVVYNHIENEHLSADEWPFDQPFYLIFNIAVGGMLGGQKGIDDRVFPQKMEIDYVRVYQKK